ncbi:GNAT family N-acetyltransferase [Roseovarius faecimaris]|uniref:GNAT family N-acetyltransferase n=1 Tax=Roseovarius faecimaris TaxID=2494550 RepID=UPI001FE83967|nr:GNAT family N-acetyltransferase [Roseovarius faecimaris]
MQTIALEQLSDDAPLRVLVHDYLAHEIKELRAVSGLEMSVDELVETTFEHIEDYLPPSGGLHVVLDEHDALHGCVFLKMIRPDACEIKRLFVQPSARGLGLGRRLMEAALAHAQRLGAVRVLLDTGIYDTAAQALYRKLGFREIDYYPEGENDRALQPYLVYMQLDF